jgi:hypothetical protein
VNSSTGIFYTAFYADCEHELQSVTTGQRLCLAFNLVRGRGNDSFNMELGELTEFSTRLARVEAALRPWEEVMTVETRDPSFLSDKLAIPLEHKYTKKNLSFDGLKGADRSVAQVLKNCRDTLGRRWLDLHLCILTLHKEGLTGEESDCYRYSWYPESESDDERPRRYYKMEEYFFEDVTSRNWVGSNNRSYSFNLDIDQDLEVVIDYDKQEGVFNEYDKADEVEFVPYMGNNGPSVDEWYHTALLVIWPKKKSVSVACHGGASGAVDIVETRAAEGDPDVVTMLRDVLSHCEESPATVLKNNDLVVSRLLKLCLDVGALEDVVRILELLSKPYTYQGAYWREPVVSIIGVKNAATATAIAGVVKRYGWGNCGTLVMKMLTEDQAAAHGGCFAQLALELQKVGCKDAAVLVAKRTLELVYFPCANLAQLNFETIGSLGEMIFSIKSCMDEVGLTFVDRVVVLENTEWLCCLVAQIYAALPKEVLQQAASPQVVSLKRICQVITMLNFHRPGVSLVQVMNFLRPFFHLGDEQLLNDLIQAFLDQSRVHKEQHFLKEILGFDEIWKDLSSTSLGRSKLELLAEEQISVLAQATPPFTWCMPFAKFTPGSKASSSKHGAVQEFLRGPREKMEYAGVNEYGAYDFVRYYFDGRYVNGYSAKADIGELGSKECVIITKTRTTFEHDLEYRKKDQQTELSRLRQWLGKLQGSATGRNRSGSGGRSEEVNLLDSPDASNEREKRRKVSSTTEYIDLSLDDDE